MMRYGRLLVVSMLLILATLAAWSWSTDGMVYQLTRTDVGASDQTEALKSCFAGFGAWAPFVYAVLVTIEVVVAPLPGLMLYAPGGILFGPLIGGGMALAGNIIGAGIACGLTRSLGSHWLNRFFSAEQLNHVQSVIDRRGTWLIFLLRINPLTSSDIVSYAAGLTRIPIWKVMLSTGAAMTPLCFGQAWLAEGLLDAFPQLIYPLIVCCIGYLLAVVIVVGKMMRQPV